METGDATYNVRIENRMVSLIGDASSQPGTVVWIIGDNLILTSEGQVIAQDEKDLTVIVQPQI